MFYYNILNQEEDMILEEKIIEEIMLSAETETQIPMNGTINIIFEDDENIKNLNNHYRGIDKTTDVLSFHYHEDYSSLDPDEVAGEIILSSSKIAIQSEDHGHSEEEETYRLIIHSVLHLVGYDHEEDAEYKEMDEIENNLINRLNLMFKLNIQK